MKLTPQQSFDHIKESLILYLETQYKISDSTLYNERATLLRSGNRIAQVPFIESTPAFSSTHFLSELEAKFPNQIAQGLSELVRHGVPVDRYKIYDHQEKALLASFTEKPNLLVATGTGSGKTEAFLLPVLSKILNEAKTWTKPSNEQLIGSYDAQAETWKHPRRNETRTPALRSIILYPMNALVNDQLTRLRKILSLGRSPDWQRANTNGNLIHFGMYTGLTPVSGPWNEEKRRKRMGDYLTEVQKDWNSLPEKHREMGGWPRPASAEMLTRWDMQMAPPDILVTNYSMLEYMLMRPIENDIFELTRSWIENNDESHFTLVIDEAHTYSGAKGTEVAHLIRRLKERLGLSNSKKFQAIATTASVPEGSDKILTDFTSNLFGEIEDSFSLIRAKILTPAEDRRMGDKISLDAMAEFHKNFDLSSPRNAIEKLGQSFGQENIDFSNGEEVALYDLLKGNAYIEWLRNKTARNATPINEISNQCWVNFDQPEELKELATSGLLSAGSYARSDQNNGTPPLLSMRIHAFFKGIAGLWACMDPQCSECTDTTNRLVGKIYTEPKIWCGCGSRILEILTCRHCGLLFLGGIEDSDIGCLWPWSDNLTGERINHHRFKIFGVEKPDASYVPTYRSTRTTVATYSTDVDARPVYEVTPATPVENAAPSHYPSKCPRCQRYKQPSTESKEGREVIEPLGTKGIQSFATIVEESFRFQQDQSTLTPNMGRKALVFSDSRREASKLATDLKEHHFNDAFKQCLYRILYECPTCNGEGTETVADSTPRIGHQIKEIKIVCRHCHGSKVNSSPTPLSYQNLSRRILEFQLSRGIDPSRQRIKSFFAKFDNSEETIKKALLFINADLLKEITDEVYSLEPLGLAKWQVPPMHEGQELADIGTFDCLSPEESKILIQSVVRLLATEKIVSSPDKPWDWGTDEDGNPIVEGYRKNTVQKLFKAFEDWHGKVIPFNVSEHRKLGRYIIAISEQLLALGKLPDELSRISWVATLDTQLWQLLKDFGILTPAGIKYEMHQTVRVPYSIQLSRFVLHPIGTTVHRCLSCKYVMSDTIMNVCLRCGQSTEIINSDTIHNYFRRITLYAKSSENLLDPAPFKVSEHTAQVDSIEARNEERWFQDIFRDTQNSLDLRVDALSVTTTMEMGIDIGSLLFVGLRNVPPSVANYQQRAGRAGRRGSAVATVFTFAQPRSHDQYYFDRPKNIISDPPRIPSLNFANKVIAKRHFRSLILRDFFTDVDLPNVGLFETWGTVQNFIDSHFKVKLQNFIHAQRRGLIRKAQLVVSSDVHGEIEPWLNNLPGEIDEFVNGTEETLQLFTALMDSGLLPKYAFPIDVVSLSIPGVSTQNQFEEHYENNELIQRDLKIAISEYAPGAEITKQSEQRTWKYKSVGLNNPFEPNQEYVSEGIILECNACQGVTILEIADRSTQKCSICQGTDTLRLNYIVPKGFTVDGATKDGGRIPYKPTEGVEKGISIPMAKLMIGENSFSSSHSTSNFHHRLNSLVNIGNLLLVNKGYDPSAPGFELCPKCGRWLDITNQQIHHRPADVPPYGGRNRGPKKGSICNHKPPYQSNQLVLAHKFHSEVLLLGVNLDDSLDVPYREASGLAAWLSFGTLLANGASKILQIDPNEIKIGARPVNRNNKIIGEVFIYDDVPGGAGYARNILENLPDILQKAMELANHCSNPDCTDACYQCMMDYRNQSIHSLLDRKLGGALLNYVLHGHIPEITQTEVDSCIEILSQYTKINYTTGDSKVFHDIYYPVTLENTNGDKFAIRIIHPLSSRLTYNEFRILKKKTGYNCYTFTSFDLQRRPFWVLGILGETE
jgi:ATP-dependent helicase YprA (DUF1998 family)